MSLSVRTAPARLLYVSELLNEQAKKEEMAMMIRIPEPLNVMSRRDGDPCGDAPPTSPHFEPIDSARAAENIAEWREYLPEDCVNAMVKVGWHSTV
jgi:hypothetical protein